MRVSAHQPLIVANKHQIPKTSQLITCIGDDTSLDRLHGGTSGCRQIYAVIVQTFTFCAKPGNQASFNGPNESTARFRRLW